MNLPIESTRERNPLMVPLLRRLSTAIVATLLLAACSPIAPNLALPTPLAQETTPGAAGPALTPRADAEVSAQELAQILQIARWQFDLRMPAGRMIHYQLELDQPSQEPLLLASFSMQSPQQQEDKLLVALYPIAGSILDAKQIQIFIGVGGNSSSAVVENPASAYTFVSPLTPARPLAAEGEEQRFTLMEFSESGRPIPNPENARLVLVVRPGPGEP